MLHKRMWNDDPFDQFDEEEFVPKWICFGKGGGGGPSTQTVNQTNLPEYAEPFFTRLLERTEAQSNQPYSLYPNQRIAEFNPDTLASFDLTRDYANSGIPEQIGDATDIYDRIGAFQANTPFTTQRVPGQIEEYMNPYIDQVLDRGQRRALSRFDEQQLQRDSSFAQRGAFSNARRDIASEIARRELNEQLLDIEAQALSSGFDRAGDLITSDEQRLLQAQIESERARQGAAGLNLQAAQGLAGMGELEQNMLLQQADALGRIGALQEERDQAGLDLAYTDFVNQRDYDRNQLNFYSGILRGVPVDPQSETLKYQTPPSPLSQAIGLGLGGLGLYKAFSGGG